MRVECKIKKENIDVCIIVEIYTTYGYSNCEYRIVDIGTKTKEQRKFKFKARNISNDYGYRKLDYKDRQEYVKKMYMSYVTDEDIQKAINFAYEKMKPKFKDVRFCAN